MKSVLGMMLGVALIGSADMAFADSGLRMENSLWYMGLRAGTATTLASGSELTARLNARGHNVSAQVDENSLGGSVYAGYRLHRQAAVEFGYTRLGQYETRVSGSSSNPARFQQDFTDELGPDGNALSISLRFDFPLAGPLLLTPRFGGLYWVSENGGSERRGGGGLAGVGLTWPLSGKLNLSAGYELLVPSGTAINQLLLGMEWRP